MATAAITSVLFSFQSLPPINETREKETFNDHNTLRCTLHLNISNTQSSGSSTCSGPTLKQLTFYCWKTFLYQNDGWKHHQQDNFLQDPRVKCFYTMLAVGSDVQPFISKQHHSYHYPHHSVLKQLFQWHTGMYFFILSISLIVESKPFLLSDLSYWLCCFSALKPAIHILEKQFPNKQYICVRSQSWLGITRL